MECLKINKFCVFLFYFLLNVFGLKFLIGWEFGLKFLVVMELGLKFLVLLVLG